jgi:hypothetical protein
VLAGSIPIETRTLLRSCRKAENERHKGTAKSKDGGSSPIGEELGQVKEKSADHNDPVKDPDEGKNAVKGKGVEQAEQNETSKARPKAQAFGLEHVPQGVSKNAAKQDKGDHRKYESKIIGKRQKMIVRKINQTGGKERSGTSSPVSQHRNSPSFRQSFFGQGSRRKQCKIPE